MKKEEDGRARKKIQKNLQMEFVKENRRRKSTTFKPPSSGDFQNAADTYCDYMPVRYGGAVLHEDRTDEDRAMSKQALDKTNEIEQSYDDEDTVMMKRLIEIRDSLWT